MTDVVAVLRISNPFKMWIKLDARNIAAPNGRPKQQNRANFGGGDNFLAWQLLLLFGEDFGVFVWEFFPLWWKAKGCVFFTWREFLIGLVSVGVGKSVEMYAFGK